jgi:ABC-type glycerol-3-phosphate transport system substrate-binding protein
MKKFVIIVLTLALAAALAGCGGSDSGGVVVDPNASAGQSSQVSQSNGSETAAANAALYFESNGVKIRPYDLGDDVLSALGNPTQTFEAASCAYQGKDYFYYYDGFQLTINELEGTKRVTAITVSDDTVMQR